MGTSEDPGTPEGEEFTNRTADARSGLLESAWGGPKSRDRIARSAMRVRDVRWEDFSGLVDLYYTRYEEVKENQELGILTKVTMPTLQEETGWFSGMYRQLLDGTAVACVAEEGDMIEGVCEVHPRGDHVEDSHVGVLGMVVRKESRGRGIGSALLENVLKECRGRFEMIELVVFSTNEKAKRLYERHGFRAWGISRKSLKRGGRYFDEVHMSLDLSTPESRGT